MKFDLILKLISLLCSAIRWITRQKPTPITLLIVDDDSSDAELLEMALKKKGYVCEIAASAETAQGLVRHTYYPIIFVDMRLRGMSGQALLRILSRDSPNAQAVVVCGEPSDLATIPASRFISIIRKPVTLDAIEEMLAKLKPIT